MAGGRAHAPGAGRRIAGLVPGVVLLLAAAVMIAHDVTWLGVVGVLVGVVGLLAVALPVSTGHGRGIAVFVAGVAVTVGGVGLVHGGWLPVVGHRDLATVTGSSTGCAGGRGCRMVDRLTLVTPGGERIPGRLELDFPSRVDPGDTVAVRWDPTGLVANPRTVADASTATLVTGAFTLLAALAVLGFLAYSSVPEPAGPRGARPDNSPEGIRRRLEAEAAAAGSAPPDARREFGGEVADRGDATGTGVVEQAPHEG